MYPARPKPPISGILTTAALFGAMHLAQNAAIWQSFVLITVVGFVFGVIRHVSGSTKASDLGHSDDRRSVRRDASGAERRDMAELRSDHRGGICLRRDPPCIRLDQSLRSRAF